MARGPRKRSAAKRAADPRQGLALVESQRPDVLLTDLKMPAIAGTSLTTW